MLEDPKYPPDYPPPEDLTEYYEAVDEEGDEPDISEAD